MQGLESPTKRSGKAGVTGLVLRDLTKELILLLSDFSCTCKVEDFTCYDGDGAFPFEKGVRKIFSSQQLPS